MVMTRNFCYEPQKLDELSGFIISEKEGRTHPYLETEKFTDVTEEIYIDGDDLKIFEDGYWMIYHRKK